jgi:glycosyltransferase involved in cell wall biosynthesis
LNDENPIDVVEFPEIRADGFFVPSLVRQPRRIVRLHTAWIFIDKVNSIKPTAQKRLMYWLEQQSILAAHCISSPSYAMLYLTQNWIASIAKKRYRKVIANPVDSRTFLPSVRRSDPPEIVFIGRPERRKGFETIIRALPEILQSDPKAIFRFFANPKHEIDRQPVQAWVRAQLPETLNDRVLFTPVERSQLPAILAGASLCVMPSLWENFPYAVLEAMACGLPIVASRTGGLPELLEQDVSGLLVPAQDPPALAEAVLQILKNPDLARNMGAAARSRVEKCFSREAIVPEMLRLYQELTG